MLETVPRFLCEVLVSFNCTISQQRNRICYYRKDNGIHHQKHIIDLEALVAGQINDQNKHGKWRDSNSQLKEQQCFKLSVKPFDITPNKIRRRII